MPRGLAGGVLRRGGRDVPAVPVPEASGLGGGGRRVHPGAPPTDRAPPLRPPSGSSSELASSVSPSSTALVGSSGPTRSLLASAVLLAHHHVELRGPGPVLLACTQSTDFKWWTEIASAHGDGAKVVLSRHATGRRRGASYSAVPWR